MEKAPINALVVKPYHRKEELCYTRPGYREGRWERAVKVYTINQESKYLLAQNVPCVKASKELIELFALYGEIDEYKKLNNYPTEEFTEVYWVKYKKIQSARFGKKKLDNHSFFGGQLHVCYAPEFEDLGDVREKLNQWQKIVRRKSKEYSFSDSKKCNEKNSITIKNELIVEKSSMFCHSRNNKDISQFIFTKHKVQNRSAVSQKPDQSLPYISSSHATLPVEIQKLSTKEVYPNQNVEIYDNEIYKVTDNLSKKLSSDCKETVPEKTLKRKRIVWNITAQFYAQEPGVWNPLKTTSLAGTSLNFNNMKSNADTVEIATCHDKESYQPAIKNKKNDGRKRI